MDERSHAGRRALDQWQTGNQTSIKARLRYRGPLVDCELKDNKLILAEEQRGIAAGQSAVVYDDDHVPRRRNNHVNLLQLTDMTAQEIRKAYLEFFVERGHKVIPRALVSAV